MEEVWWLQRRMIQSDGGCFDDDDGGGGGDRRHSRIRSRRDDRLTSSWKKGVVVRGRGSDGREMAAQICGSCSRGCQLWMTVVLASV